MAPSKPPARTIPPSSILAFFLLVLIAATPSVAVDYVLRSWLRAHFVIRFLLAAGIFLPVSLVSCRLFLRMYPLPIGEIEPRSRGEFAYCVYMLFCLLVLPVLYMSLFPIPLRRVAYILLGMRVGKNTHFPGWVLDPPLVQMGDDVAVGFDSVCTAHAFDRGSYALWPIVIGNDVTIGVRAVILPGVHIGDGAIIAVNSVVTKGTRIGPGEIWGGVPARLIKRKDDAEDALTTASETSPFSSAESL